jgi:hypothetical protein
MEPMEGDYERNKVLYKLRTLRRNEPNRDRRWRRTSWYGVTPETMTMLMVQGFVEKRQVKMDQPVQWRDKNLQI